MRLETYPKLSLFRVSDPPPEIGVFGGVTIVNNFFVLRDINILSKEKMFKINHSFDSQHFRLRALNSASIFRDYRKNIIFSRFFGWVFLWIFLLFWKIWTCFQKKTCSKSITLAIHSIFECARAIARARFSINFSRFPKKHDFFIFFGAIFSMNIFVDLRDMDMFSKPKVFKIYHFFDL